MNKTVGTAMNYDELRGAIAQRHRALSGRLQQIAEFVLDHPTDVALGTVAEIAERSGVPPSAIVRFAHALGFGGFTEMQQVFRTRLVAGLASLRVTRRGWRA
jgi:DNA-binding MurR/RpiR family transcriptional regulator